MTRPKYPTSSQLAERREWAAAFDRCWVCGNKGTSWMPLEVHEIASRAQAPYRWAELWNYFQACGACNGHLLNHLPEVVQLAMKLINDPDNYDRPSVNLARGRAPDAITELEVRSWVEFLQVIRGAA